MRILATIVGVIFIIGILQDSFETVILPRRVSRRFRLSRMFYTSTWTMWSSLARKMRPGNRREFYLSYFGPLSLIFLLVIWAVILVFAFALIQWGTGTTLSAPEKEVTFWTYLYMSGTTFITLGIGDVTPLTGMARFLVTGEAALGFGFLALIIGYVPVIYQSFSRREARNISPGCSCRLTLQCHGIVAPPLPGPTYRGTYPIPAKLGKVECRIAGEPPLLSRPDLLPLPA